MRTIYITFFLLLGLTIPGHSQVDSLPIRLAGVIYSSDSSLNTPFVNIINYRTGTGVISDSLGHFKTQMLKSDSLVFKCLGFEDNTFKLPDTVNTTVLFVTIRLTSTSYYLDVVDIYALSRINQFRYDFKNLPLPTDDWEQQLIIPGVTKSRYSWIHEDEKFNPKKTFDGPISALYYKYSAEGKSLQKLAELINDEPGDKIIDEKFNMQMLSEFTGYTGDTLIAFNLFLNFSRSYLLSNDGYTIFVEVKRRIPEFEKKYFNKED